MVEDRLVGIKSREVYEAPGAIALITAHQELENVTRRARAGAVQAPGRAALGRAGLRRPLVLAAAPQPRRVRRLDPGARHRRGPDDAARRPRGAHRAPQRGVALRLQPRHLRRGRPVRPVAGQGLRAALGPALEDRGEAGPGADAGRVCPLGRAVRVRPGRGDGGAVEVDAVRLGARALRHRRLPRPRPGAARRGAAHRRAARGHARRAAPPRRRRRLRRVPARRGRRGRAHRPRAGSHRAGGGGRRRAPARRPLPQRPDRHPAADVAARRAARGGARRARASSTRC